MLFTSIIYSREVDDGSCIWIFTRSSLEHNVLHIPLSCLFKTFLNSHSNAYCEGKMSVKHTHALTHPSSPSSPACRASAPGICHSRKHVSPTGHGVQICHPACLSTRGSQSSQPGSHNLSRSCRSPAFSLSDQRCLVRCTKSMVSGIFIYSFIKKNSQMASLTFNIFFIFS